MGGILKAGFLSAERVFLFLIVLVFVIVGILPLLGLFVEGWGHYKSLMLSKNTWVLLEHSIFLASCTTLAALAAGVPLGILLGKTDLPCRLLLGFIFAFPLILPLVITAISWASIVAGNNASSWFFGPIGCILVHFTVFMPIVLLLVMAAVANVHPSLEEAARLVTRWPAIVQHILIPLIRPSILLAAILVFLMSLGDISVPLFLRYSVFPVETLTQFSSFYNFGGAVAGSVPLICITCAVLFLEKGALGGHWLPLRAIWGQEGQITIRLGRVRWGMAILVGAFAFATVVLPILALIAQSASLSAYKLALERGGDSILRSFFYAIVGASVLTFVGFFLGYIIHHKTFRFYRLLDFLTVFLFALPGAVLGVGLIHWWNRPWIPWVYGTPLIVVLGLFGQYIALPSRVTVAALSGIPLSMEDVARTMGVSWLRRIVGIVIPLAKRGLIAGWLVGFIFCLRDTGVAMLVYPPGYDTLPIRIFTLMANGSETLIAALAVLMVVATLIPFAMCGFFFTGRKVQT